MMRETVGAWQRRKTDCLTRGRAWMTRYDRATDPARRARLLARVRHWLAEYRTAAAAQHQLERAERFGWGPGQLVRVRRRR